MSLFRPRLDRIAGYKPGEQPQESGWIKLNTNENPYPPSPKVIAALQEAIQGPLNLYPDPLGTRFRKAAAERLGLDPEWILPANGSDENLTLILRSFVDSEDLVAYPYPSYILYETLADIQGGRHQRIPLNADWSWNWDMAAPIVAQAKLVLVPNPNSPSGNRWRDEDILRLVPPKGLLVLDEAYGDFADRPHGGELLKSPQGERIIVTRSFSKSYSLAGIRAGYAIAHPHLIEGMRKAKDSYNCDRLALAAATAALEDQDWMQANTGRIRATRKRLTGELESLDFAVVPSQANFIWCVPSGRDPTSIYEALKARKILVRYMVFENTASGSVCGLRISIGTDGEIDALLKALRDIL